MDFIAIFILFTLLNNIIVVSDVSRLTAIILNMLEGALIKEVTHFEETTVK